MKIRLFSIIILLALSISASADEIKGRITDSKTMKPIEGVTVILKNFKGIPVSYSFTDSDGIFTLRIQSAETDSTTLEARIMGYKPYRLLPPFEEYMEIQLTEDIITLNETIIKAEQVKKTGDTITYYIPTLVSNDDRVLGDVLTKLPGISVDREGFVKAYGRPINKLYIEGNDLLEGRYNIATKNISPKDIKEVKIYENHQPVRALEGIVESDQAAIDIILKNDSRAKWIGTLQAEAGGSTEEPWVPYSAGGMLMNISRKFQTINTLKTDAAGNDITSTLDGTGLSTDWSNVELSERYTPRLFTGIYHLSAPIQDERTRFNTSYSATTNNKFSIGKRKNLKIGISGLFEHEVLSSYNSVVQKFMIDDGKSAEFTEYNNTCSAAYLGCGNITAELNTKKLYLRNNFQIEFSGSNANNNLTGTASKKEDSDINGLNVLNYLRFFRRLEKSGFGMQMFTQYTKQTENMNILSDSDNEDAVQDIQGEYFYNNIKYSHTYNPVKWFRLSSQTELPYMRRHLITWFNGLNLGLPPETYSNDAVLQYLQPKEYLTLNFTARRFSAYIYIDAWYQYINYKLTSDDTDKHNFAVNPSIEMKYDFGPRFTVKAMTDYTMSAIDEQQIFSGLIMQDYKYLTQGRTDLGQLPGYSINMELEYRDPLKGWFIKGKGRYSAGKDFEQTRYFLNDDYIVNVLSNNISNYVIGSSSTEISKTFFKSASKLTGTFDFSRMNSTISQNNIQNEYTGSYYVVGIQYKGNITRWLGINYSGSYEYSTYVIGKSESIIANHSTDHNITFTLLPFDKLDIDLSCDFYLNKYGTDTHFSAYFINASAWYYINPDIQVFIHAKNLTDQRNFSYTSLQPMQITHFEYKIRPLNILLGVQVKF